MQEFKDNYQNIIKIDDSGLVTLRLFPNIKRKLGSVEGDSFITTRKIEHIFRKNDSWGINEGLIKNLEERIICRIVCSEENIEYYLTIKEIKEKGKYMFFKDAGFEKQLFVPRADWNIRPLPSFREKMKELTKDLT